MAWVDGNLVRAAIFRVGFIVLFINELLCGMARIVLLTTVTTGIAVDYVTETDQMLRLDGSCIILICFVVLWLNFTFVLINIFRQSVNLSRCIRRMPLQLIRSSPSSIRSVFRNDRPLHFGLIYQIILIAVKSAPSCGVVRKVDWLRLINRP